MEPNYIHELKKYIESLNLNEEQLRKIFDLINDAKIQVEENVIKEINKHFGYEEMVD